MGLFNRLSRMIGQFIGSRRESVMKRPRGMKVYGSQGRLEIDELDIGVPLYDTANGDAQALIDNEESAAYLRWYGQVAIADHANQANFSNLSWAVPGKTVAVIDRKAAQDRFVCYRTQIGHIRIGARGSNQVFDEDWKPVHGQNNNGLTIYTCIGKPAKDVMDVRLTYWRREEAID